MNPIRVGRPADGLPEGVMPMDYSERKPDLLDQVLMHVGR